MYYFFFYKNRFSSSIALALSRKVRDAFFFSALSVAIALVAVAVLSRGSNGGDSHRKERERVWSVKRKSSFFSDFTFFSKRGDLPTKMHHHLQSLTNNVQPPSSSTSPAAAKIINSRHHHCFCFCCDHAHAQKKLS